MVSAIQTRNRGKSHGLDLCPYSKYINVHGTGYIRSLPCHNKQKGLFVLPTSSYTYIGGIRSSPTSSTYCTTMPLGTALATDSSSNP